MLIGNFINILIYENCEDFLLLVFEKYKFIIIKIIKIIFINFLFFFKLLKVKNSLYFKIFE